MAHFNQKISAVMFVMAVSLGLVGCGGDNSEIFPPGTQAAGSAGAAGGSNVQPPSTGGSGGTASTGGSAGSSATCVPGVGCDTDGAVCDGEQGQLTCYCGMLTTPAMRDKMECGGQAGAGGSSNVGGSGGNSGVGGAGGSTSTGGSSGNSGGSGGTSEVTLPDAGTSGSGGSSGVGGSGGSTSTGGSSGSGGATGAGTLEITIVPPTSGQHSIKAYVQALAPKPGEPDWNTEHAANGTRLSFSVTAYAGSGFDMNGYYDPPSSDNLWQNQFCDKVSGKPTVAVMAKFNGQPVAAPSVIDNGKGGCNLTFKAVPLVQDYMDADGDGEPYGQGLDCDDSDAFVHHGAVETPDDNVDYDCDLSINPLRVMYRVATPYSQTVPQLYDWSHNGKAYSMAWNSAGYYEVGIEKPVAARQFNILLPNGSYSAALLNGACVSNATVTSYLEQFNTTYNVELSYVTWTENGQQKSTCHDVLTNFQP